MSIFAIAAALSFAFPQTPPQVRTDPVAAPALADAATVDAARDFLLLMDQGRWSDGFTAAGGSFTKNNTLAGWTAASEQARVPLGAVRLRDLLGQEFVPAPPRGYAVVRFRTGFANKPGAVETVTLEREGAAWRVVGIVID